MFKIASFASVALAGSAMAHPHFIDSKYNNEVAAYEQVADYSNGLVFTQTDASGKFVLDLSQTFATPDPPKLNTTLNFTLGGVWTQPVNIKAVNFKCNLFGAKVYDQDFPVDAAKQSVQPGGWTYTIPFDVPSSAPAAKYDVSVQAMSDAGEELFVVTTFFNF